MKQKYKKHFASHIWQRGVDMYYDNAVLSFSFEDDVIKATVNGSEYYEVEIVLDENRGVHSLDCDCPYANKGNTCKHMAAVLYMFNEDYLSSTGDFYLEPKEEIFSSKMESVFHKIKDEYNELYALGLLQKELVKTARLSCLEKQEALLCVYEKIGVLLQYKDKNVYPLFDKINQIRHSIYLEDPSVDEVLFASLQGKMQTRKDTRRSIWYTYLLCANQEEREFQFVDEILQQQSSIIETHHVNFLLEKQIYYLHFANKEEQLVAYLQPFEKYKEACKALFFAYFTLPNCENEKLRYLEKWWKLEKKLGEIKECKELAYSLLRETTQVDSFIDVVQCIVENDAQTFELKEIVKMLEKNFNVEQKEVLLEKIQTLLVGNLSKAEYASFLWESNKITLFIEEVIKNKEWNFLIKYANQIISVDKEIFLYAFMSQMEYTLKNLDTYYETEVVRYAKLLKQYDYPYEQTLYMIAIFEEQYANDQVIQTILHHVKEDVLTWI